MIDSQPEIAKALITEQQKLMLRVAQLYMRSKSELNDPRYVDLESWTSKRNRWLKERNHE